MDMHNELDVILKRIDSRLLSKLWGFYRNYFSDDSSCLYFIYNCIKNEPESNGLYNRESKDQSDICVADNDDKFIPRRMLNAVERLVSAAKDMDQIRRGQDAFKIVFLVTCVETLQQLRGNHDSNDSKKELLFSFFCDCTSEDDKQYISERFELDVGKSARADENSFQQFIGVINEYRNCAAHEGVYWDSCFADKDESPRLLTVKVDLEKYSMKNKKEHCFTTHISYNAFEAIFIRTCISFIQKYLERTNHTDRSNGL